MSLYIVDQYQTVNRGSTGLYSFNSIISFNENISLDLVRAKNVGYIIGSFGYINNSGQSVLETQVSTFIVRVDGNKLIFNYSLPGNPVNVDRYSLLISPGYIKSLSDNSLYRQTISSSVELPIINITSGNFLNEGQTANISFSSIGLPTNALVDYSINGIDSSRISGNSLSGKVLIDSSGRGQLMIGVLENNRTDGPTTATVTIGNNLASASFSVIDTSLTPVANPTYSFISYSSSVNEGLANGLLLQTTNVPAGTILNYSISGIAADRMTNGSLSGTATVDSNGRAYITLDIRANNRTDGPTTATVTIGNNLASASFSVIDTSLTPVANPTYSFIVVPNLISEGADNNNSLLLQTKNVPVGTVLNYSISGIAADRLVSGSLSGTATVDANGQTRVYLDIKANNRTDGPSTATVTIGDNLATASVQINDISITPVANPFLAFWVSGMNEGESQNLLVNTGGLQAGTVLNYSISGIAADRLNNGSLSGIATVDGNGQALINFGVRANNRTDGQTIVNVTVSYSNFTTTNSFAVIDTSLTLLSNPIYSVISSPNFMNEGESNGLILQTTNVPVGTVLNYSILGLNSDRLTNGSLVGTASVDGSGQVRINLDIKANNRTDGPSNLTVVIGDNLASASWIINDTSLTPSNPEVNVLKNTPYYVTQPNLKISGTELIDKVILPISTNNALLVSSGLKITVEDKTGAIGNTTLDKVERLKFTDKSLALDIGPSQNAGSLYMLYKAAFNRAPDEEGMGYWLAQVDSGKNLVNDIAAGFVKAPEFVAKYGTNPTNAFYVDQLYLNVLGRPGEAGGVAYWNQELNNGARSKAEVLVQFATLPEGAALVANLIANGIQYQEWIG